MTAREWFVAGVIVGVAGVFVVDEFVYQLRTWLEIRRRPFWPPPDGLRA